MMSIEEIRKSQPKVVVLGNHPQIIQSILDFDYLSGKKTPSVAAIYGNETGFAKYFWGRGEILLPIAKEMAEITVTSNSLWFLNLLSGRRTLTVTQALLEKFPSVVGGAFFAENVPELHALTLYKLGSERSLFLVGPASVGLVVPGVLKLGAIGGVTPEQIEESGILTLGNCAVISASGGMTNELINMVKLAGKRLSFAFSTGGDRFPLPSIGEAFALAQDDPHTTTIIYYGELGGTEEYELIALKKSGKLTKPVIIHIAGTIATLFAESPQFGHAKAKAHKKQETATAKRAALKTAGFLVSENFANVLKLIESNE